MRFVPVWVFVMILIRPVTDPARLSCFNFTQGHCAHPFDAEILKKEVCCKFMEYIFAIVGLLVGLAIGVFAGISYRKKVAEKEIGSAELEATRLINEAIRSGESRKKEMLLEAKEEIHKSRTDRKSTRLNSSHAT